MTIFPPSPLSLTFPKPVLLLCSPARYLRFTILGQIFVYVTVFFWKSNHWGSHIPPPWMVHAGCFCSWHAPVRDMNVMIFWIRAMECMYAQTRRRSILSSERVLGGMESEPTLTPREKSPLLEKKSPQRRTEPMTLHKAGQRAQHTTNEIFQPQHLPPPHPSAPPEPVQVFTYKQHYCTLEPKCNRCQV